MPKIIYINPPLTMEERYGKLAQGGDKTAPIGLCYLAAKTREEGFETEILDAAGLSLNFNDTANRVLNKNPDYVGITSVTISIHNAATIAKTIKEMAPQVPIILGGPHITAIPLETMSRFDQFDVGVIGEGEITIVELLNALENRERLSSIQGLVIREHGEIKLTSYREFIKNLDTLPMPAWDLLEEFPNIYTPNAHTFGRIPVGSLITSRGCYGNCTFCDRSVFGRKMRFHSSRYVIEMMKHLMKNYGIKEIEIHDDNFLAFERRTKEICQTIIDEKMDITWNCVARVNQAKGEIYGLLKKAGCWQIGYGFESGSQRILDVLKKQTTLEQGKKAIRLTRENGMRIRGFFMIGNPTETIEDIMKTIDFAKNSGIDDFHITYFTPLPGSEIYKVAKDFGEFRDKWNEMNLWTPVFIPYGLSKEDLVTLSRKAFKEFYFRPNIIWNYFKNIKSLSHLIKLARAAVAVVRL